MTNMDNNLYFMEKKSGEWETSDPIEVLATQPSIERVCATEVRTIN